jgi:hypothetical protein
MSPAESIGLPEALERAATALPADADAIRPANGDPYRLHELLDAESATRVLQWLLENEPLAGGQLAADWADDPDLDPAPLLGADAGPLSKAAKKALRRAHHRLRTRGVEFAEPIVEKVVATIGKVEEALSGAVITPIDPRGSRMAYLVEANPSGGTRIFEIMLDDERGIGAFEIYSAARGKASRFLQNLTRRGDRPAVDVPPDSVRALIARAAKHQPATRSAPRGFSEWRSRITSVAAGTPTPGMLARAALGAAEPAAGERALELVRAKALGPWPPENPALQEIAEKIVELEKSEIEVSDAVRREQVDGILDAAVTELYGEPFASRCAERFEEMAYVYWKWEQDDDARACLAAADAFGSSTPTEQPVARALLEVLLSPVLNRLETASGTAEVAGEGR